MQGLLFEGISGYVDVLRQAYLLDLSRTSEQTIESQTALEAQKLESGSGTRVDVLQARSRLQLAREKRVVFEGAFEDANSRYAQVIGRRADVLTMALPQPPLGLLPATLDDAIEIALARHPALAGSDRQVDIARARQRTVRADYFPRVDLVGRANWEDDINATPGIRRDWSVARAGELGLVFRLLGAIGRGPGSLLVFGHTQ